MSGFIASPRTELSVSKNDANENCLQIKNEHFVSHGRCMRRYGMGGFASKILSFVLTGGGCASKHAPNAIARATGQRPVM